MKRATTILTALAATIVIGASLLAAPASARTQCKSKLTLGNGFTEDLAVTSWRHQATNAYGSAWANFSLAKSKQYSQQNLLPGN